LRGYAASEGRTMLWVAARALPQLYPI